MRLPYILLAVTTFASGSSGADAEKIVARASQNVVQSIDARHDGNKRFLRLHDDEEEDDEERTFGLGSILKTSGGTSKYLTPSKDEIKTMAHRDGHGFEFYKSWAGNGLTDDKIRKLLKGNKHTEEILDRFKTYKILYG
ncbi:hypothetical protein PHYBOEH_008782 [Phytophthora boehmeriae]|uniref:RxLR effector protein n=1 Tax=Phytophthora boehmeriae TaxID=109152 RepID=A0A8T1W2A6_9STRA|nr:hypothetical protein PHYBOEH_008782 [Phytophthora boehmeriae]